MRLVVSRSTGVSRNRMNGAFLNWMTMLECLVGHPLAGADVERNVGPTPVVDDEFQGGISFGVRIGATFSSLRYAGTFLPSISPSPYWPRTAQCRASSGVNG